MSKQDYIYKKILSPGKTFKPHLLGKNTFFLLLSLFFIPVQTAHKVLGATSPAIVPMKNFNPKAAVRSGMDVPVGIGGNLWRTRSHKGLIKTEQRYTTE